MVRAKLRAKTAKKLLQVGSAAMRQAATHCAHMRFAACWRRLAAAGGGCQWRHCCPGAARHRVQGREGCSSQHSTLLIDAEHAFCGLQGEKAAAAPAEEEQAGGGPPAPKHVQRKLIRKVKFLERECVAAHACMGKQACGCLQRAMQRIDASCILHPA